MPTFRRDRIPSMASCFINFAWAFSSFLSVDMIKLYTYHFMHDVNYPSLFYGIFAISLTLLLFLKFNKVFTSVMIIWFNFFIHLMLVLFIYFPVKNRIFLRILFGLWSHLFALNVISSIYLASYNMGGLNGLIIGTAFAYYLAYFLLHGVDHPSDFSIASRKATCNWFITVRCIAAIFSFKFYREYLEFFFYFEYRDSVRRIAMMDLFKWVDGKAIEVMSSVRISEVMPSSIDYHCIWHIIKRVEPSAVYLAVLYLAFTTSSFFSPLITPTPLVLSVFVRDEVYFLEFLGGFLGVITAILMPRRIKRFIITLYYIHYALACIAYWGFNTYFFGLFKRKNALYFFSFSASYVGTFLLVYCFINYIIINAFAVCENEEKNGSEICCMDDTATCLCYSKKSNENCGPLEKDKKKFPEKCLNLWVSWNNHSTYRDWSYSDCEFCLSQNYKNKKSICSCPCAGGGQGGSGKQCCSCCCSKCGKEDACSCDCKEDERCKSTCCCKKSKAKNYLLRNCIVSCCPYCDMCLLLQCVEIPCVCSCSHKEHIPRNSIASADEKKDGLAVLTKIKLRLKLDNDKHIFLCSYSDSPDLKKLQSLLCCCGSPTCTEKDGCCIKCCNKEGHGGDKACGKHFDIADYLVSSCCHYPLKIWISLKELNSTFHIGQNPFKNKYDQINSLIFTNEPCRDCCKDMKCCKSPGCTNCKPVDIVKIVEQTGLSQSGGSLRFSCNNPSHECKCCSCCGDTGACKCACSCSSKSGNSNAPGTCSCSPKKCAAIKVLPTNLPYQFRKVDIRRSEMVALICFAIMLFCVLKMFMALVFSLVNQKDTLKINFVVSEFTTVYGNTVSTFPLRNYESDLSYAMTIVPDFEGPDEFLLRFAVDTEIKRLDDNTRLIKGFMDELNSLLFDQWLEGLVKDPNQVLPANYSKLRFYRKINAFLEFGLSQHAFKTADRIHVYFERFPRRWDIEWKDFERRFLQNLKVYTDYSLSLNSVGYFDTNTEFQRLINNRQSLILKHLNSKNDQLTQYLTKSRDLYDAFKKAKNYEKLPREIDLWEFRFFLIKTWAAEKTLFLNWTPFVFSMERIVLWNNLFRRFYMDSFIDRYGTDEEREEKMKSKVYKITKKGSSKESGSTKESSRKESGSSKEPSINESVSSKEPSIKDSGSTKESSNEEPASTKESVSGKKPRSGKKAGSRKKAGSSKKSGSSEESVSTSETVSINEAVQSL